MKVAKEILREFNKKRYNGVITLLDLQHIAFQNTLRGTLKRLVDSGEIIRIAPGYYIKNEFIKELGIPKRPTLRAVAEAYARTKQIKLFPTIEEIKLQCETINAIRQAEIDEVKSLLERVAVRFVLEADKYTTGNFQSYFKSLSDRFFDVNKYPQSIQKSNYGRNFIKASNPDLSPSFYYTRLIEILEKYL